MVADDDCSMHQDSELEFIFSCSKWEMDTKKVCRGEEEDSFCFHEGHEGHRHGHCRRWDDIHNSD